MRKKVEELDRDMYELFGDCEEQSIESFDGTRIAYRTKGKGLPLIVCTGVFTSYMFFHHMKNYFSPRHQFILWDYRGHPDSGMPADLDSLTVESDSRDLKAVMDDLDISGGILIGFSMGVMTCLEFYKRYPKKVLGLVLLSGPYKEGFGFASSSPWVQRRITDFLNFGSKYPWLLEWLRPIIILPINIPIAKKVAINPTMSAEEEMDLYFRYAAKMDWHAGLKALASMSEYNGEEILDKVKVPTLIVCGQRDTWAPKRIADEMHRRIRGSEYTIVPGGSHATPAENPEMINFRVDLFLRTHFHDLIENE